MQRSTDYSPFSDRPNRRLAEPAKKAHTTDSYTSFRIAIPANVRTAIKAKYRNSDEVSLLLGFKSGEDLFSGKVKYFFMRFLLSWIPKNPIGPDLNTVVLTVYELRC